MKIKAYTLNAFAGTKYGGNPAGVVLDADKLSNQQMLKIAKKINFTETAFVRKSTIADFNVKFFTPHKEVNLCGHATIATFYLLAKLGKLRAGKYTQATKAGVLDIEIKPDYTVFMHQIKPQFLKILNKKKIADALNISPDILISNLPVQIVSTGFPTIIVPLVSLAGLHTIKPSLRKCIKLCHGKFLLHLFTLETINKKSTAHSRNFFPVQTLDEEAATGTATGALACYLYKYNQLNKSQTRRGVFEQGQILNRPSKLITTLTVKNKTIQTVKVGGRASNIKKILLNI